MANIVTRTKAAWQFGQMLGERVGEVPSDVADEIQDVSACSMEERNNLEELGDKAILLAVAFIRIGIATCVAVPAMGVRKVVKKFKKR